MNADQSQDPKIHPVTIPGCDITNEELGKGIARLRFDQMEVVFKSFHDEIISQMRADRERRRHKLAAVLLRIATYASLVLAAIQKAWELSSPYMQHEFAVHPVSEKKRYLRLP